MQLQDAMTPGLMTLQGILGTATGQNDNGQLAVVVYVNEESQQAGDIVRAMPPSARGTPIVVRLTSPFVAFKAQPPGNKPGGGGGTTYTTTSVWPRPVPIGVSTGGNAGACLAGTIACRLKDASGKLYALSNNHVYALETQAGPGSPVVQPGTYDTGCLFSVNNVIGYLFEGSVAPIRFDGTGNTIDAAIALLAFNSSVQPDLGTATPADGYGTPSSTTTEAAVGMAVQKYGRTSKMTKGTVTDINATTMVGYTGGNALFVGQIIVQSKGAFLRAGDSGSLLVTNDGKKQPVGLLFAGNTSGNYAIANHIDAVLKAFGVTVDGE